MELKPMHYEETLRRLTLDDERYLADVLARRPGGSATEGLEPRIADLARLGALIGLDAGAATIDSTVAAALAAGASPQDIVDVLLAVGPVVGSARLVSAAPRIARGLGYDVLAALERLDSSVG